MPYKDLEKRKQAIIECHKKAYYQSVTFRFRKDTETSMQEALDVAVEKLETKAAVFAKQAVIEKLIRDGYLPES